MALGKSRKGPHGYQVHDVECDFCHFAEVMPANDATGVGHAHKALSVKGWLRRGKKLKCPNCIALQREAAASRKAKVKKEPTMNSKTNNRTATSEEKLPATSPMLGEPTPAARKVRRDVMAMLATVYDDANNRYFGPASDDTVATETGAHVSLVASLRSQFFGDGNGNEAHDVGIAKLRTDLEDTRQDAEKWMAKALECAAEFEAVSDRCNALAKELERLKK